MATVAQLLDELITGYKDFVTLQSVFLASTSILVYDWLLTFNDELTYIWRPPWSLPQAMFVVARYGSMITAVLQLLFYDMRNVSPDGCAVVLRAQAAVAFVSIFLAESILLLKVIALFRTNRFIYYTILTIFILSVTVGITFIGFWSKSVVYATNIATPLFGCSVTAISPPTKDFFIFGNFIILAVWELLISAVAVYSVWTSYQSSRTPLSEVMHRDGLHYLFFCLVASLANLILLKATTSNLSRLLEGPIAIFHCVFVCRMLLHLRSIHSLSPTQNPRSRGRTGRTGPRVPSRISESFVVVDSEGETENEGDYTGDNGNENDGGCSGGDGAHEVHLTPGEMSEESFHLHEMEHKYYPDPDPMSFAPGLKVFGAGLEVPAVSSGVANAYPHSQSHSHPPSHSYPHPHSLPQSHLHSTHSPSWTHPRTFVDEGSFVEDAKVAEDAWFDEDEDEPDIDCIPGRRLSTVVEGMERDSPIGLEEGHGYIGATDTENGSGGGREREKRYRW
ncbi:hypothetical protein SISSUDRAFT_197540 [Sistotremastrum suecicum HHB10207 ss-3]|uniref:DUF6533 domain-containing protein n=1 Tax=Sistotremastrum suecicum HHB10207 ss-3 TaxID=1314776 RepID=A0A166AAW1_9AGAM|nr:hypothetical protein SISSUDRAFT_197540 [Sistotremastrum suecicum HHB10207 ss-3]